LGFYRDVLAVQFAPPGSLPQQQLINVEFTGQINEIAMSTEPAQTLARVDAIERARLGLQANVAPLLVIEALTIDLRRPELRGEIYA
jgi:DNA polymerase-3 subunit delta'